MLVVPENKINVPNTIYSCFNMLISTSEEEVQAVAF